MYATTLPTATRGGYLLGSMPPPGDASKSDSSSDSSSDSDTDVITDSLTQITYTCHKSGLDVVSTKTGEIYRRTYCDSARCAVCAPAQCKRLARIAAWSLKDAPHVYSLTISPVDPDDWPKRRIALMRAARRHGGVGMMSAVEQAAQTHVHALMWSDRKIKESRSSDLFVKTVGNTYKDRYNVAYYLTKTIHRDNDLSKHLSLNGGLAHWTRGFFYGYTGFKAARSAYVEARGWKDKS